MRKTESGLMLRLRGGRTAVSRPGCRLSILPSGIQARYEPSNMTKKKQKQETRESFMFPSLHQVVLDAVSDEIRSIWFRTKRNNKTPNNEYSTHVMGSFKCHNGGCSNSGRYSKKVAILIRGYPENGYDEPALRVLRRSWYPDARQELVCPATGIPT